MNKTGYIMTGLLAVLLAAAGAPGGSIYLKSCVRMNERSLFADDKAGGLGDVLTIEIKETAKVESKKQRKMEKKSDNKGEGGGGFNLGDMMPGVWRLDKFFTLPYYDYENESSGKLDGKADWTDEQKYVDQITVVVEDVMPNGNLLVLGKRVRQVAGNKQTIQASGIVRPSDIDANNRVDSDRVANFHIVYVNRGQDNNFLRPGWFMRVWNLLNPF